MAAHREVCLTCRKAKVTCYCPKLRPFESDPMFVILAHPRELRNSVATGRMLHLSATNSVLIDGHDFTNNERLNALLENPELHCVLLYPGQRSLDLTSCSSEDARAFVPSGKKLALLIVDGTWDLARGMINRSANLRKLPQIRFTPSRLSAYEIRKQPDAHCLSTLECAHWMIERLSELGLAKKPINGEHHAMIQVFGSMVEQQILYAAKNPGRRTEGERQRT